MKKFLILFSLYMGVGLKLFSQTAFVEYQYLQIINSQEIDLIADNIDNAESVADRIVYNNVSNEKYSGLFFIQLSRSYYRLALYEKAFFSLLRQRILFPEDSLEDVGSSLFFESASMSGVSFEEVKSIREKTAFDKVPDKFEDKLLLLIEVMVKAKIKNEDSNILKYTDAFAHFSKKEIPCWLIQWKFYTIIEINITERLRLVDFKAIDENKAFENLSKNDQKLVLTKNINYLIEKRSFVQAKIYISDFKKYEKRFGEKFSFFLLKRKYRIYSTMY